jgi:hypothetical protein
VLPHRTRRSDDSTSFCNERTGFVSSVLRGQSNRGHLRTNVAAIHINVLDFILPPLREVWEPRGRFSRTTAGEELVDRAERHQFIAKTTCVKANRTLDALSDGAFECWMRHGLCSRQWPHGRPSPVLLGSLRASCWVTCCLALTELSRGRDLVM